jgi:hypothetical protein
MPNSLQRIHVTTVLLPESFRGGCSFGAVLLDMGIVSPAVTYGIKSHAVQQAIRACYVCPLRVARSISGSKMFTVK